MLCTVTDDSGQRSKLGPSAGMLTEKFECLVSSIVFGAVTSSNLFSGKLDRHFLPRRIGRKSGKNQTTDHAILRAKPSEISRFSDCLSAAPAVLARISPSCSNMAPGDSGSLAIFMPIGKSQRVVVMKNKAELEKLIEKIASPDSPVGMDAVYVHALILDKLSQIETHLLQLQNRVARLEGGNADEE